VGKVKRWLLTCAQNDTLLHRPTWTNLLALAKHYDAEIMVSRFVYDKSVHNESAKPGDKSSREDRTWAAGIEPYGVDERRTLAKGLEWCGELQILPLTVSGPMSTDLVAAMRNNRTEIRGARACLGVLRLDERYRRPADEEVWWFEGVCGALSIARVSGGPGQWIRSVTLNVHFGDVDRKRPKLARWTHLDQQERYPGDTGLSRMPLYNLGTTRGPWPEPT